MIATQCLNWAVTDKSTELTNMGWETLDSDYKAVGKALGANYSEEWAHLACKMFWKHGKGCVWYLCNPSSYGWGGRNSLEFPRIQQGKHFPSDTLSAPHPFFPDSATIAVKAEGACSLHSENCCIYFSQKEIWVSWSCNIGWHAVLGGGSGKVPPRAT